MPKKSPQRFCSETCQHEWQRGNTGFNNPRFQGDYVKCENCGKEYLVGKYKLEKDQRHFCSAKCRQEWYSKEWSQSEDWKEKSRARAVKILTQKPPSTQTKPQIIINDMLDRIGIQYRNEEPFVYYSIDNYLYEFNLAIEVMGDYWHGSPLKYKEKINDKQRHIIARDKAKRTFIYNYYGFNILYLWESDIINNPRLCEELIMHYINGGGAIENFHSFNYSIDNDRILSLNKEVIIPYQERKVAC